ncbi:MAG: site-2 protease family protein [Candidatus Latescibacterota bacterium]|nr:MAG: site-2 protease family protein [Candidatus Latescibacterota bacterium]
MDISPEQLLQFLVGYAVLLFSLVVHENAHGLAAERLGDPTAREMGRITMNPLPHLDPIGTVLIPLIMIVSPYRVPLIGWAKPVPVNSGNFRNPIVHDAYVAAAGPISNFILAVLGAVLYIVVLLVYKHVPSLEANGGNSLLFFRLLCASMIQINCVLGIFNLLPIPPLDGHWILFRYLPSRWAAVMVAIRPYGFFILLALLWTGILGRIIWLPMQIIAGGLFTLVGIVVTVL